MKEHLAEERAEVKQLVMQLVQGVGQLDYPS
jgi:hypothetical protein